MDPITLLQLLHALNALDPGPNSPNATSQSLAISQPARIDTAALQESFADLTRGILKCYHPTARYQLADIVQKPWDRQGQYGADGSVLVKIRFFGAISGSRYEMVVGILGKNEPKKIRTAVLADNAPWPPNSACALDRWTALSTAGAVSESKAVVSDEAIQFPVKVTFKDFGFFISLSETGTGPGDRSSFAQIVASRGSQDILEEKIEFSGELRGAWAADLDGDSNPELILWVRGDGSGRYGEFLFYELRDSKFEAHQFPVLSDAQSKRFGYSGHDSMSAPSLTQVFRKFPSYKTNDPNCCPSGPMIEVAYGYRGKSLILERIRQLPTND